jgi:predicted N-acetyltransferase YhbS
MKIHLRTGTTSDAADCGAVCYEAFRVIAEQHGFPPDFSAVDAPALLSKRLAHPGYHVIVAEVDDRIVGSVVLDERSTIAGLGPLSVLPTVQNQGIGRILMVACLDRARERGFPGVRLMQAAFHNRSLSLYTKLGFETREPVSVMQGRPPAAPKQEAYEIRPAIEGDIPAANRLCERVYGVAREGELREAIQLGTAMVCTRDGCITGYSSEMGYPGHAVAESNTDLQALMAASAGFKRAGILVPTRNAALLRWCLEQGLRIVQPMNLMTFGVWHEPRLPFLPSILY